MAESNDYSVYMHKKFVDDIDRQIKEGRDNVICPKAGCFNIVAAGKCSKGHDGTICDHCHSYNEHGKCPHGFTGITRNCNDDECGYLTAGEICPWIHDGTVCNRCSRYKENGKCPNCCNSHRCSYLAAAGICPNGHDGRRCLNCNRLISFGHCLDIGCIFARINNNSEN